MDESPPSPPAAQPTGTAAESLLFGRYRVVRELACGSLGRTVLAEDTTMAMRVAIRLFPKEAASGPIFPVLPCGDVGYLFGLRHPGIVATYAVHRDAQGGGMVLEYVDGPTLEALAAERPDRCFEVEEVLPWLTQVAAALDYLHEKARLVHRDLQPSHLLLAPGGQVKVSDCDLVLPLSAIGECLPGPQWIAGTPPYTSPQQLIGEAPVVADDIYALGATAYTLLTGRPPFSGGDLAEQIRHRVPPRMTARRAELGVTGRAPIPQKWEEVIASCLAKEPQHRPRSAGAVVAGLTSSLPGHVAPPPVARVEPLPELAPPPRHLDENVQFTVFRPPVIEPLRWYPLPAFAHLSERALDAPEDEPDPVEEVQRQARAVLGKAFEDAVELVQDSRLAVPREGELTFVPEVAEVTFNPPRATFLWIESVHRVDFRLRAAAGTAGRTLRGRLTVFLGQILLADIPLALRVEAQVPLSPAPPVAESARPYRKIFASYSHRDGPVVAQFERYVGALGDEYLRDAVHLRAGEVWSAKLREMIEEADVFQLFWSWNSMRSRYCREEWEYALSLKKENFVRPTYWESPIPSAPEEGLPGDELRRLHFQRIAFEVEAAGASSPHGAPASRAEADIGTKSDLQPIASRPIAPPAPLPPPRASDTCAMAPAASPAHGASSPMMASGSGPGVGGLLLILLIAAAVVGALAWLIFGR